MKQQQPPEHDLGQDDTHPHHTELTNHPPMLDKPTSHPVHQSGDSHDAIPAHHDSPHHYQDCQADQSKHYIEQQPSPSHTTDLAASQDCQHCQDASLHPRKDDQTMQQSQGYKPDPVTQTPAIIGAVARYAIVPQITTNNQSLTPYFEPGMHADLRKEDEQHSHQTGMHTSQENSGHQPRPGVHAYQECDDPQHLPTSQEHGQSPPLPGMHTILEHADHQPQPGMQADQENGDAQQPMPGLHQSQKHEDHPPTPTRHAPQAGG